MNSSLVLPSADGYRGIWYCCNGMPDPYRHKYSGGLGTYCSSHLPLAWYAPAVRRTFFCYGGRPVEANRLLHMVACYDHASAKVCRPRILLDKQTDDAHDNASLMLDEQGFVYVFCSSHGTAREAFIYRSARPYSIDAFSRVYARNFSYPQPWWVGGAGALFLHTLYVGGRRYLHWMTSPDGVNWPNRAEPLAAIPDGHYQLSWRRGSTVATCFNYHPAAPDGHRSACDGRTNLYYLQTRDIGRSWQSISGRTVRPPLTEVSNPALVDDFEGEGLLVYLVDMNFDQAGRPIILVVTSRGHQPGPENGPRVWTTVHWTGRRWQRRSMCESDSNYDVGCLHAMDDGSWRVIGPTLPGPQRYNPGGEMALWTSDDSGNTWEMLRQITRNSVYNHTYARRPVAAHADFFALWADGHGRMPSPSRLYFCTAEGHAFRLPQRMDQAWATAEPVS
jgi:hypothetical protein